MIIKAIFYFLILFGFTFFAVQGSANTGVITIAWFGYIVEINAMFAVFILLLFVFLVQIMMHVLTVLGILPSVIKYRKEAKKLKSGLEKLKAVSLQLSLGNKEAAKKLAQKANRIIPQFPIFDEILNIKSKTDYSNEFIDLKLAKNKVDEFIANFEDEKALKIVEKILAEHPKSQWARKRQYGILLKLEEFNSALNILELLLKEKTITKEQYKLEKCFIFYELALNEDDSVQALKFAESGMKASNLFFKLIEETALILKQEKEEEKALKLIISTVKNFNEGILSLELLKEMTSSLEKEEQVKWLNKFAKADKRLVACQIAKAEALLLQENREKAIEFLSFCNPSKEVLLMLSKLYKEDSENQKALDSLELSQTLEFADKKGLLKEYNLWKLNIAEFDNSDNKSYIEVREEENVQLLN